MKQTESHQQHLSVRLEVLADLFRSMLVGPAAPPRAAAAALAADGDTDGNFLAVRQKRQYETRKTEGKTGFTDPAP